MTGPALAAEEVAADQVAAAVTRCRSVARLSGGPFGGAGTYLPGRHVPGVVVRDSPAGPEVEVRVVGRFGPTMDEISREVETSVRTVLPKHRLLIVIDDLDTGDGGGPAAGE